jgi:hypothetical protein
MRYYALVTKQGTAMDETVLTQDELASRFHRDKAITTARLSSDWNGSQDFTDVTDNEAINPTMSEKQLILSVDPEQGWAMLGDVSLIEALGVIEAARAKIRLQVLQHGSQPTQPSAPWKCIACGSDNVVEINGEYPLFDTEQITRYMVCECGAGNDFVYGLMRVDRNGSNDGAKRYDDPDEVDEVLAAYQTKPEPRKCLQCQAPLERDDTKYCTMECALEAENAEKL